MSEAIRSLFAGQGRLRPDSVRLALVVCGFMVAGTLFGLVVSTGNMVMTGLAVGGLLSLVLLSMPAVAVWLVLPGTMLVSGPLIFHTQIAQVDWAFSVLGIFLMICGFLRAAVEKPGEARPTPLFVKVSVLYLVYGLVSIAWQPDGALSALPAVKRHFQYIGLIFAFAYIAFPMKTIKSWLKLLLFIACLQLIYVLYQRFYVVPGWGYTFDAIVGTFEATQDGRGSSGSLAFLQCVAFGGMLCAWRERLLRLPSLFVLGLLVLAPLLIAEVNVIFFAIPITIGVVFIDVLKNRPMVFVGSFACLLLVLAMIGGSYLLWQQQSDPSAEQLTIAQKIDVLISYNFGDQAYGSGDKVGLNRTTVYPFWFRHHGLQNPQQFAFGHGIGSTWPDVKTTSTLLTRYGRINIGLTSVSLLLWELGVVGLVLYCLVLALAWMQAYRLQREAPRGYDRALARTALASMTLSILFLFYSDALSWLPSQQVPTYMTIGLIAYLSRRQAFLPSRQESPARSENGRPRRGKGPKDYDGLRSSGPFAAPRRSGMAPSASSAGVPRFRDVAQQAAKPQGRFNAGTGSGYEASPQRAGPRGSHGAGPVSPRDRIEPTLKR